MGILAKGSNTDSRDAIEERIHQTESISHLFWNEKQEKAQQEQNKPPVQKAVKKNMNRSLKDFPSEFSQGLFMANNIEKQLKKYRNGWNRE